MQTKAVERERLAVRVSAAVFIEDGQGRLLLLQQAGEEKGHKWGPPAGGMEANEDPVGNALREAKEEIGAAVLLTDLIGIYTVRRESGGTKLAFVFRGKLAPGQEIKIRAGEIENYRYFSLAELDSLILEGMLYKPEFNVQNIRDWKAGRSFPLQVLASLK